MSSKFFKERVRELKLQELQIECHNTYRKKVDDRIKSLLIMRRNVFIAKENMKKINDKLSVAYSLCVVAFSKKEIDKTEKAENELIQARFNYKALTIKYDDAAIEYQKSLNNYRIAEKLAETYQEELLEHVYDSIDYNECEIKKEE